MGSWMTRSTAHTRLGLIVVLHLVLGLLISFGPYRRAYEIDEGAGLQTRPRDGTFPSAAQPVRSGGTRTRLAGTCKALDGHLL